MSIFKEKKNVRYVDERFELSAIAKSGDPSCFIWRPTSADIMPLFLLEKIDRFNLPSAKDYQLRNPLWQKIYSLF